MVIGKTMRGTGAFASLLLNSAVYKYAKNRGVWYYRLLLSQQFSDVITNLYEMNRLEKKLNPDPFSSQRKKVFCVDEQGNIYDNNTGEIFGNTGEVQHNKFDLDNEEEQKVYWEGEETIIMPDKSKEEVKPKRGRPRKS
tara:strand:- start:345 stop:761 length:417 start_codon:yes stop_codon:yes gene_type:complete